MRKENQFSKTRKFNVSWNANNLHSLKNLIFTIKSILTGKVLFHIWGLQNFW